MLVWGHDERLYLLCHGGGDDAVSWVEQLDPHTLGTIRRSPDLDGGPAWPGGIGVHDNGSLYVAFGAFLHRLTPDLALVDSLAMRRRRPYNSFVVLVDGTIVMKDFGGARPGGEVDDTSSSCEVVAVDPDRMVIVSSVTLPEGSVARLSADGDDVYVVGSHHLWRLNWIEGVLQLDEYFTTLYRDDGEGYGWDAVIGDGYAWFLNNGAGSERFDGSLLGKGVALRPQRLVRVNLRSGDLHKSDVHDQPFSVVANPPAVVTDQKIVIGYDSAHGVVSGFRYNDEGLSRVWSRSLNHGCHPIVFDGGLVLLNDFSTEDERDHLVLVNATTGDVVRRVPTDSPVQSVLFGLPGRQNDVYLCSFTHVTRVAW